MTLSQTPRVEVDPRPPHQSNRSEPSKRLLGRLGSAGEGKPLLVFIAGLHGNEPAGVEGALRVLDCLDEQPVALKGEFVVIAGNPTALAQRRRYLSHDLNRIWTAKRLGEVRATGADLHDEELDLRELDRILDELLLGGPERPRFLVDLHTFSAPGPAFGLLDDSLANRDFAFRFPVPFVLGLEEELSGTLLDHLEDYPVVAVGFESGQHDDPVAVDQAEAALWIALEASGVIARASRPEVAQARRMLRAQSRGLGSVFDVRYRHPIVADDGFRMESGFRGFQPVRQGQVLAHDRSGGIRAGEGGLVLMPLYQAVGDDGFFLIRRVHRSWLLLSGLLRRLGSERWLWLLPGIRRVDGDGEIYRVDRRIARWYALELLHLLGFRRQQSHEKHIIVRRRDD